MFSDKLPLSSNGYDQTLRSRRRNILKGLRFREKDIKYVVVHLSSLYCHWQSHNWDVFSTKIYLFNHFSMLTLLWNSLEAPRLGETLPASATRVAFIDKWVNSDFGARLSNIQL